MEEQTVYDLVEKARRIRCHIIRMVGEAASGHPGGSLSAVEILTALYFREMRVKPEDPTWPERDRFVLCKGHASPLLYAVLAERGFFPVEELKTFRRINSRLQGHPDMRKVPGVEMSTGSLGQGLSVANGMALAARLDGLDYRVYALLGDGEIQEGQVWEAAMAAAHYRLDNLVAFLDHNGLQIDGRIQDVMSPEPVEEKWRAFGWHVLRIDGHDYGAIFAALAEARQTKGRPTMIIADTVKGKGVSFMENDPSWHGLPPTREQMAKALAELGEGV
ncbi:MAG: transketolase [Eubacteriales bacterium]|nr:transketolase [Eubacteriales bacterium]